MGLTGYRGQHTSTPAYFGYAAASYDLHHNIISRHKAKLLGWTGIRRSCSAGQKT